MVWHTGLSGVPPDSVRCTSGLRAELLSLGNFQSRRAITHRTVRCTPDSVRCSKRTRLWNLKASGIRNGCSATSAPMATCKCIKCTPARAEVRHAYAGAPDTLQYMSGTPPDIQAGPEDRAPTVGTQRLW
jgi:hypothetical protein